LFRCFSSPFLSNRLETIDTRKTRIRKVHQMRRFCSFVSATALLLVVLSIGVMAQETGGAAPAKQTSGHSKTAGHGSAHEGGRFPEIEALLSNEFRTVSYVQPLYRGLNFEAHYFGVKREIEAHGDPHAEPHEEWVDIGTLSASWTFRLGEHVKIIPGFGLYVGEGQETAPSLTFRWDIEKGWLVSQGLFVASLYDFEDFGRVSVWDGNHVSVRWKRIQLGPSWERIHTRHENEWKGGVRGSVRVARHLTIAAFVLAPKTEFRAGVIIHPGE
jgi:hypothetical protein